MANVAFSSRFRDDVPRPFKYDLNLIHPKVKAEKNFAIFQDSILFYQMSKFSLIKVFLVINQHAIFMYKSQEDYLNEPTDALAIAPFGELKCAQSRSFISRKSELNEKRQNNMIHGMRLIFKTSYQETAQQIMNFRYKDLSK